MRVYDFLEGYERAQGLLTVPEKAALDAFINREAQREQAARLGISQPAISQALKRAFKKIRQSASGA